MCRGRSFGQASHESEWIAQECRPVYVFDEVLFERTDTIAVRSVDQHRSPTGLARLGGILNEFDHAG